MTDLTHLKNLEAKATKGEWRNEGDACGILDNKNELIADFNWGGSEVQNVDFVCAVRNAFPALAAELEQLRAYRASVEGQSTHHDCNGEKKQDTFQFVADRIQRAANAAAKREVEVRRLYDAN